MARLQCQAALRPATNKREFKADLCLAPAHAFLLGMPPCFVSHNMCIGEGDSAYKQRSLQMAHMCHGTSLNKVLKQTLWLWRSETPHIPKHCILERKGLKLKSRNNSLKRRSETKAAKHNLGNKVLKRKLWTESSETKMHKWGCQNKSFQNIEYGTTRTESILQDRNPFNGSKHTIG